MTAAQRFSQYQGVVLDTNLMLLYCIGQGDPYMISKFTERLSRYGVDDYYLLVQFIALFRKVVTTPHVLTETVNLIDKKSGRFDKILKQFAAYVTDLEEIQVSSNHIVSQYPRQFLTFGFTDLVLHELAQQAYVVLTDDNALWSFIDGRGSPTLNFEQLRTLLIQKGSIPKRKPNR